MNQFAQPACSNRNGDATSPFRSVQGMRKPERRFRPPSAQKIANGDFSARDAANEVHGV